jgi:hypothetical protein
MIELNDKDGRLIVALQVERRKYFVFVEGQWFAQFRSGREALACARFLAMRGQSDSENKDSD